jgi:hypothetical protein
MCGTHDELSHMFEMNTVSFYALLTVVSNCVKNVHQCVCWDGCAGLFSFGSLSFEWLILHCTLNPSGECHMQLYRANMGVLSTSPSSIHRSGKFTLRYTLTSRWRYGAARRVGSKYPHCHTAVE